VTDPGTETLYRDILKIPEQEFRYVLRREFRLYSRYMAIKQRIATIFGGGPVPEEPVNTPAE
jgi:hypothetical protein